MDARNKNILNFPSKIIVYRNLNYNEKLLFTEIWKKSTDQGLLIIEKHFFAKLFEVDERTISNWIFSLEKEGLISSKIFNKELSTFRIFKLKFPLP